MELQLDSPFGDPARPITCHVLGIMLAILDCGRYAEGCVGTDSYCDVGKFTAQLLSLVRLPKLTLQQDRVNAILDTGSSGRFYSALNTATRMLSSINTTSHSCEPQKNHNISILVFAVRVFLTKKRNDIMLSSPVGVVSRGTSSLYHLIDDLSRWALMQLWFNPHHTSRNNFRRPEGASLFPLC